MYNTSSYESVETLKELEGLVDVYLPDFKYWSSDISHKYSGRADYADIAKAAIEEMYRQVGKPLIEDGIIKRGVVVRHLVLPTHTEDSINVLKYLIEKYGDDIWYSVMSQYFPSGKAKDTPPLNRRLKTLEYKAVISKVAKMGIENCFIQELCSADEEYVPQFIGEYPEE